MVISEHISYKEATKSGFAVRWSLYNEPTSIELKRMRFLAETLFEPARERLGGHPIKVSSFYRSKEVNEGIGGDMRSQHMKGEAIDLDAIEIYHSNVELFNCIYDNFEFDKLIAEDIDEYGNIGWIHVSKKREGNRKDARVMVSHKGRQKFFKYDIDKGFYSDNYLT